MNKFNLSGIAKSFLGEANSGSIDKSYTHFAVRKSDNKIVTGWEYEDLDKESIKDYTKMDIEDIQNTEFKRGIIKQLSLKWNISHTQVRRFVNKYALEYTNLQGYSQVVKASVFGADISRSNRLAPANKL